jgi:hypothetical protein
MVDVVPNICVISQLEVLTVTENKIVTLACDVANMVSLVMLDLRGNVGLSQVAEKLLQQNISSLMVYLRTIQSGLIYGSINLSRRGLAEFPIEVHHGNGTLDTLCLAYNEISRLPEAIKELRWRGWEGLERQPACATTSLAPSLSRARTHTHTLSLTHSLSIYIYMHIHVEPYIT